MKVQPIRSYRAAPGAVYNQDQAQKIGEHLEQHPSWPSLTTEQVVDAGRPGDSPLHGLFEWRDEVAADQYRKVQARNIINHLVVVEAGVESKAFHSVSPPEPGEARTYLHLDKVRMSAEDAGEVLEQAESELQGWLERYNRYQRQLGPLFGAVYQGLLDFEERRKTA